MLSFMILLLRKIFPDSWGPNSFNVVFSCLCSIVVEQCLVAKRKYIDTYIICCPQEFPCDLNSTIPLEIHNAYSGYVKKIAHLLCRVELQHGVLAFRNFRVKILQF